MIDATQTKLFEQLAQKIDRHSKLLRIEPLMGGVSAQVTALEIERSDGETQKLVVHQHGEADLRQNPQIAADEFNLLQQLQAAGLAVPTPYYVDQSGEIFATPYIVVEYIEGNTEFAPSDLADYLLQTATYLSKIHHVDGSIVDLSFLPQQTKVYADKFRQRPAKLDDSLDEGRIRDMLEAGWPLAQRNPAVLLHGDFWPGNILWRDGRLVAVIDWEDAMLGDPLADLANTRLEILWAFGSNAMHDFTQQYRSMNRIDFANLPYWDLYAALKPAFKIGEWAADAIQEKRMRDRHKWFVTQAFEALSVW